MTSSLRHGAPSIAALRYASGTRGPDESREGLFDRPADELPVVDAEDRVGGRVRPDEDEPAIPLEAIPVEADRDRRDEPPALLLAPPFVEAGFPSLDLCHRPRREKPEGARGRLAVVERPPREGRQEAERAAVRRGERHSDVAGEPVLREEGVLGEELRHAGLKDAGDAPHDLFARRPVQLVGEGLGRRPARPDGQRPDPWRLALFEAADDDHLHPERVRQPLGKAVEEAVDRAGVEGRPEDRRGPLEAARRRHVGGEDDESLFRGCRIPQPPGREAQLDLRPVSHQRSPVPREGPASRNALEQLRGADGEDGGEVSPLRAARPFRSARSTRRPR